MKSENVSRKVAFYIRVSTERQARVEEGSLKNQEQMLHTELRRRNEQHADWGIYVESYVDEGISGKDTNRPAFQKMLRDIELGKINAVMFTELSRLSRSLKDFLNIFEFAQKHECGLICLKTEIDTTSPYKSLITKILMIFAEFEREMTSRRTAINAYERSRRGLANGGIAPLGYKRDKYKKGHLLIDEKERKCVEEIFSTYLKKKSIKKTVNYIKTSYGGQSLRLKNITRSKIYTILTNKTYIGIREIGKRDKRESEEVVAAWKPIIEIETFTLVQSLLKNNKDRFHAHGSGRYEYLFSGLFRCGQCGEKLQGKSAYSSMSKKHYYYSHKSTCAKGGLNRIDAELVHRLVFDWLKDISTNGKRFKQLQEQGEERLQQELALLQKEQVCLEEKAADINSQVEARIRELIKTDSEIVRKTIEQSIESLEEQKQEIKDKQVYVEDMISQVKTILDNSNDLFKKYGEHIQKNLKHISDRNVSHSVKPKLQNIIAKLLLTPTAIKTALSGVNRKGPVSAVFALSPPDRLELPT
jgi:site-specific DNA recombinase